MSNAAAAPATMPQTAVALSEFTQAVYSQFENNEDQINPASIPNLPSGYHVVRNIQMADVALDSHRPKLYGVLARCDGPNPQQVVAIRGTATVTEWWDNLHFLPVPFRAVAGSGNVSEGFYEIYQGMTCTDPSDPAATTSSLFDHIDAQVPVAVTGHSLGGALATLMAVDMFVNAHLRPQVWTLGSPKVGDAQFAGTYGLHSGVSWRIYNVPDVIPQVPIDPLDEYQHVNTGYAINSGNRTRQNFSCFHHLSTYMSVLSDGSTPIDTDCLP